MMRHRSTALVGIFAFAIHAAEVASAAEAATGNTTYSCTEVDVPGATSTSLWRLNNNGYIAANSTVGPYIYNPNTGVWTALPAPPASSGFVATDLAVFDLNDQGVIVGAAQDPNVNGGLEEGFVLASINDAASYSFYIHVDPANAANNNTEFRGVNDSGLITGWAISTGTLLGTTGVSGGAFVFNPTAAAIGSFAPGYATFDPVLSDGSTATFTQLAGVNSNELIAGSTQSNTIAKEGVLVGPNSLAFVQIPNASFALALRGVNDADPMGGANCDGGSCVRGAGFGYYFATGYGLSFYLDYDPATGYVQTPQIVDCSAQLPASANTLVAEGINNSDTIVGDYSDAEGNSHGVIAYAATTAPAASCAASDGGCNLSNGVIPHSVEGGPSPLPGTVTESLCKVQQDPRIVQYGTCTGHTLPVAQVCPGFGNTVIPDFLCGGAGPSHSGFALADTVAEGVDALSGIYVESEASADLALGGTSPACPQTVGGWAPRSASAVEGTVPEGNNMVEMTEGCGTSKIGSRGLSIYGIGLTLNTDALPGSNLEEKLRNFTATKYQNLYQTIADGNMVLAERIQVNACVATSEIMFAIDDLGCAAQQIVRCNSQVAARAAQFSGSPSDPNVWGDIQGRLANLYVTINSRLLGNPPNGTWPPTNLPSCH
jgi:hypothetical protein